MNELEEIEDKIKESGAKPERKKGKIAIIGMLWLF